MPCNTCKHWHPVGNHTTNTGGIYQETPVGACHNSEALDGIIRTEQEEISLSLTVIVGVATGLITKEGFECCYWDG